MSGKEGANPEKPWSERRFSGKMGVNPDKVLKIRISSINEIFSRAAKLSPARVPGARAEKSPAPAARRGGSCFEAVTEVRYKGFFLDFGSGIKERSSGYVTE